MNNHKLLWERHAYLFSSQVWRSDESITLTDNSRTAATTNGIHEPVSVIIVNHMDESPSAPWHPLHQSPAEMVESNCNLHYLVAWEAIACTKQHHLNQPHQTLSIMLSILHLKIGLIFYILFLLYSIIHLDVVNFFS